MRVSGCFRGREKISDVVFDSGFNDPSAFQQPKVQTSLWYVSIWKFAENSGSI
ncbi:hypothetical protein OK016_04020 [Vibrio chagasii]|nr:hypothetical protein [Vibrio chagasii]